MVRHKKTVPVVARGTKEPHASLRNNNFPPLPVCAAGWQIVTVSTTETPGGVGINPYPQLAQMIIKITILGHALK